MPETKIAPTEAKSREQREALVAANKKLIDETTARVKAKGIGKMVNVKVAQRSERSLQRKGGKAATTKDPKSGSLPGASAPWSSLTTR
jgi:hypothetical protein